ncbi:DJ-1-like protein B [Nymphaea thermarum]|nr:DJ-1-like protein B [Nymphaea thermarum]
MKKRRRRPNSGFLGVQDSRRPLFVVDLMGEGESSALPFTGLVLVPVANGSEEMEAVIIIDVLRRAKANVIVASVEDELEVVASRKVKLVADMFIKEAAELPYDLIVLPKLWKRCNCFASFVINEDTGGGNALNVQRTVQDLIAAGAAGCFLEDQAWPKNIWEQFYVTIELYEEGKIALAIGVLRDAVINMSGRSPSNESWHAIFSEEKSALRVILKRYEDENGFIYLEKIPDAYELPSLEGKRIVEAIPYFPKRLGRELMFRI